MQGGACAWQVPWGGVLRAAEGPMGGESPPPFPAPLRPQAPRPRPPSLQLLDPHHEVEVALGVLLDDVPHVVGLPGLLRGREHRSPLRAPGSAGRARRRRPGLLGFEGSPTWCARPRGQQRLGRPRGLGCDGLSHWRPRGPGQDEVLPGPSRQPVPMLRWPWRIWPSQGAGRDPRSPGAGWEGTRSPRALPLTGVLGEGRGGDPR